MPTDTECLRAAFRTSKGAWTMAAYLSNTTMTSSVPATLMAFAQSGHTMVVPCFCPAALQRWAAYVRCSRQYVRVQQSHLQHDGASVGCAVQHLSRGATDIGGRQRNSSRRT